MNNRQSMNPAHSDRSAIIKLTESAKQQVRYLMHHAPDTVVAVAVTLSKGGCTGFVYHVDYTDSIPAGAEIIDGDFGTVVVAPAAVLYLLGAEMDFEENDLHSRFVFHNPNEAARCGCGLSIAF